MSHLMPHCQLELQDAELPFLSHNPIPDFSHSVPASSVCQGWLVLELASGPQDFKLFLTSCSAAQFLLLIMDITCFFLASISSFTTWTETIGFDAAIPVALHVLSLWCPGLGIEAGHLLDFMVRQNSFLITWVSVYFWELVMPDEVFSTS